MDRLHDIPPDPPVAPPAPPPPQGEPPVVDPPSPEQMPPVRDPPKSTPEDLAGAGSPAPAALLFAIAASPFPKEAT